MKIGVIPNSFGVPFKEAVDLAVSVGAKGLQPYVTGGELCPERLSTQDRKDLLSLVTGKGLVFSALCADFGLEFDAPEINPMGLQRTMWMMDLAKDLGTNIITTHIGHVPDNVNSAEYANMVKSIETLGKYGDEIGVVFATETGPEMAKNLKAMLDCADTKSAKVNLDPANFVMVAGQDPVEAVHILKDYIVHTHAKDGIKFRSGTGYQELPLGEGGVPFPEYLAALKEVGYDGFLTIERECGADRYGDIKKAADYLKARLEEMY
ncbi:MAG: sugar phosphate isomerase/epimerase [Clostridia bacterium]|nr:sugar phosphate isomerase/epimerase [Clostridia bacterium]